MALFGTHDEQKFNFLTVNNSKMKLILLWVNLFLIGRIVSGEFCKRELMNSYMLRGLIAPNTKKVPFCPTITNNCCTEDDMMIVFKKHKEQTVPKLKDFKIKFQMAVNSLERLHQLAIRLTPRTTFLGDQKDFCENTAQVMMRFNMRRLLSNLRSGFEVSFEMFEKVHETFLCSLCDSVAHEQVQLETEMIGQDGATCEDVLEKNAPFLMTQNVRLVQYYEHLQRFLDCQLFDEEYNFPFLYGEQRTFSRDFRKCMTTFSGTLTKDCLKICQKFRFGAISPEFEGNVFFINEANTYFNNQIQLIVHKVNTTAFDPMAAVNLLNQDQNGLRFDNITSKRRRRRRRFENREPFQVKDADEWALVGDIGRGIGDFFNKPDPLSGNLDMRGVPWWIVPQVWALARVPVQIRLIPDHLDRWVKHVIRNNPRPPQPQPLENRDDRVHRNVLLPYSMDDLIEDSTDPENLKAIEQRQKEADDAERERQNQEPTPGFWGRKLKRVNTKPKSLKNPTLSTPNTEKDRSLENIPETKTDVDSKKVSNPPLNHLKSDKNIRKTKAVQSSQEVSKHKALPTKQLVAEKPVEDRKTKVENEAVKQSEKASKKHRETKSDIPASKDLSSSPQAKKKPVQKKTAKTSKKISIKKNAEESKVLDLIVPKSVEAKPIIHSKKAQIKASRKTKSVPPKKETIVKEETAPKVEPKKQQPKHKSRKTVLSKETGPAKPAKQLKKKSISSKKLKSVEPVNKINLLQNPELLLKAYEELKNKLDKTKTQKVRKLLIKKENHEQEALQKEEDVLKKEEEKIKTDMNSLLKKKLEALEAKQKSVLKKKAILKKSALKRTRILEERFKDDPIQVSIDNGRLLSDGGQTTGHKKPRYEGLPDGWKLVDYMKQLYSGFAFYLNITSPEIIQKKANPWDLALMTRKVLIGMGLNTLVYEETVNFEFSVAQMFRYSHTSIGLDGDDEDLEKILHATAGKFMNNLQSLVKKDFTTLISKEFSSQDDKDLITLSPKYDKIEKLFKVDFHFFEDYPTIYGKKVLITNPLLEQKYSPRKLIVKPPQSSMLSLTGKEESDKLQQLMKYEHDSVDVKEVY